MSGFDAGRLIVWARTDEAMGHSAAVEMVAGQSLDNVDIDLDCAGVLGGVVVGEDGAPVVGAVVQADDATSALRASATSDTQGGFSIGPLCAGQYALTLRSSRHASESLRRDSKAAANASLPDPSARVTSLRLIADVTLRKISGRILDSAGGGVPDVRVVAEREGGAEVRFDRWEELPSAVSDTNGRFAILDVRDGSYSLEARSGRGVARAHGIDAGARDVQLPFMASGQLTGRWIGLTSPDVVAMRVDRRNSASAKRPESYRPKLTGNRFEFDNLEPGTYAVTALADDGAAAATSEVAADATANMTLRSPGTFRLQGRVTELRTQSPVEGVLCQLAPVVGSGRAPQAHSEEAWTDAAGRFRFAAAPIGDYYVYCHGMSVYSDGVRRVQVAADKGDEVEVGVVRCLGPKALLGAVPDWSQIYKVEFVAVRPGQPASRAGISVGDVVTAVDGVDVERLGEDAVEVLIRDRAPGSVARLTLRRGANLIDASLVVGRWQ